MAQSISSPSSSPVAGATAIALIRGNKASLTTKLVAPGVEWSGSVTDQFPVPIDSKYTSSEAGSSYITAKWANQSHLTLGSKAAASEFTVCAVLWPDRSVEPKKLDVVFHAGGGLVITRPDGKGDLVRLDDQMCAVGSTSD